MPACAPFRPLFLGLPPAAVGSLPWYRGPLTRILARRCALLCGLIFAVRVVKPGVPRCAGAELRIIAPDSDNLQFMSFWVAKGAGYFADEGITLKVVSPEEPNRAKRLVLRRGGRLRGIAAPHAASFGN